MENKRGKYFYHADRIRSRYGLIKAYRSGRIRKGDSPAIHRGNYQSGP